MPQQPSLMRTQYAALIARLQDIARLEGIGGTLGWDEQVNMPDGASEARARQSAALEGVIHAKKTDDDMRRMIEGLASSETNDAEFNEYERANIRLARRSFEREVKIPVALVQRAAELGTEGYQTWTVARDKNSWALFAPVVGEWVDLRKEMVRHIDPEKNAYDVLLDTFEPGMTSARYTDMFGYLKEHLSPLIARISAANTSKAKVFEGPPSTFNEDKQMSLCRDVAADIGFNFENGRLDRSVHPFSGGSGPADVRMTTRFSTEHFLEGIGGVVHETGHSIYEQGRNVSEYLEQPVSEALGMGVHEGQSLFWERMVFQHRPFWSAYGSKIKGLFPDHAPLAGASVEDMYRAANHSQPSFIRVDADEVTYPMHIIVRFECERDLINGTMAVADVPAAWRDKMKTYLGIEPAEDKDGPLQDVHWSDGSFGYFPTYTLGAIIAAQLYAHVTSDAPGALGSKLEESLARGEYAALREWLRVHVHVKGSVHPTCDELMKSITGEAVNPKYFVDYIAKKYSVLYGL